MVGNVNDRPTGTVVLSGLNQEYATLAATANIEDPDGLGAFSYLWNSNGSRITTSGNGRYYILSAADIGKTITCTVEYTDGHGEKEAMTSNPIGPIVNYNDPPVGIVWINVFTYIDDERVFPDAIIVGSVGNLIAVQNDITDLDGVGYISYQWQIAQYGSNEWSIIENQTDELLLTVSHFGKIIRVVASYQDDNGAFEQVVSENYGPIT